MLNCTCHDAVRIIKQSFFNKLKYYEVTFNVYPLNNLDNPGIYYVLIQNEDQFIDLAYKVNVIKDSFEEVALEVSLIQISENDLHKYEIHQQKRKIINYGQE